MLEPFTPTFFRRLQALKIHTRRSFLGSRQGSHISNRRGHGLEFAEFRPYTAGDDFRHIDWGIYGRSDRLYIREFRDEQDLNVAVILDTSASMAHPAGESKFELARDVALSLGYIALSDGDTVTFSLLGQKNSPRYTGARAISRAINELKKVKPEGSHSMLEETRAAIARLKLPGKCFLISDFLFDSEEQFAMLDLLRAKNFEIVVLQILAPSELRLELALSDAVLIDAESGEKLELALNASSRKEYARALAEHIERLEFYCQKAAIPHVLISSESSVSEVVLNRLPQIGLLR